jgi:hypothetical protein
MGPQNPEMPTKVFISWSGDLSNKLAEIVRQWLPSVIQFARPYFTPTDIEKGTKWSSEINAELAGCDIGIICLTKDNLEKPWILFEAGALSKNMDKSRVCTLLFDVDTSELKGPLTIFQSTKFEKTEFKSLVTMINAKGGDGKLEESVIDDVFEMWWPKLKERVDGVIQTHKSAEKGSKRSERDILEEILELSRLGVKRAQGAAPAPFVFEPALTDLQLTFNEIQRALNANKVDEALTLVGRLAKPISFLCSGFEIDQRTVARRAVPRTLTDQEMAQMKAMLKKGGG